VDSSSQKRYYDEKPKNIHSLLAVVTVDDGKVERKVQTKQVAEMATVPVLENRVTAK
jgi:hypothetical protein